MARRIIIPARYGSTRLPAKMLLDIAGKPMLQHTYEKAMAAQFDSVVIATDDDEIVKVAEEFGADVIKTSSKHQTGTDRCAEAMRLLNYDDEDIVLNLQGDEPLMPTENLLAVADNLACHPDAEGATLCVPLQDRADIFNPNAVKVVLDHHQYALYFSRAPIPWSRDTFPAEMPDAMPYYLHVGLYAYRGATLKQYGRWEPTLLERCETLEQLRVLFYGGKIHVGLAPCPTPPGVDTAAGLQRVREYLQAL